jgi:DNA-directed RNA polymerase subunit M/transcription elongation factor TFIIS
LSCHKPGTTMFPKADHRTASNCVECHMPTQATSLIVFDSKGKKSTPLVRNHWIKVYPAAPAPSNN